MHASREDFSGRGIDFLCVIQVEIPKGSVVYADPPYFGTKPISRQKFDTNEFWDYMREISKDNKVFISEQNAPDDFKCIWENPLTRT